jgi:hypothetical protein
VAVVMVLLLAFVVATQVATSTGGLLAGPAVWQPAPSGTPVRSVGPSTSPSASSSGSDWTSIDSPPEGVGETPRPATLPSAPSPAGSSKYFSYIGTQTDGRTPVTWSPCRAIHYVVVTADAPVGSVALFRSAVAEVSRLTGLTFVDDGATTEPVVSDRTLYQPTRYGKRWAPVQIAFVTSRQDADMTGDVVGDTIPESVRTDSGDEVFVSGEVYFSRSFVTESLRDGYRSDVRATMLHELGHLVGLDHVDNAALLMNPDAVEGVVDFAPEEKPGLRSLGAGACHSDV